jgi:G:T-mismatch repair DNA endonuclease (very short patch repair protein)
MATMVNLICKNCKNIFNVKRGREKLFCSDICKSSYRTKNDEKYYVEKHCEYCQKMFKSKKKINKKFCSYECSGLNKKRVSRENRYCLECGNLFSERIKYKRNFCSEICRKKWQTKPENIKKRLYNSKEAVEKKYGVENTFQVNSIRLKATANSRETYKERGSEIIKNNLRKLEEKRQKILMQRFVEKGYSILEFNGENIKVSHPDGHIFENNRKLLVNRLNHEVELSTILQPIGSPRTTFELKICNFLKNNNINYIPNDRKIINGELDIYIPDHNIAIEIDGLHWHSEYYLNNDYHLIKTKKCIEKNIQLLHFFEDELLEKYNIIESIIKSKLGIIENKIFARKCIIKELTPKISSEFLINNHIQGNVNASIKIGLYYNDELVSIMTFGKLRNVLGNKIKTENEYEMLRFCNKLNTQVMGGASRLYSFFKLKYKPLKVISFANRRYSNGNLYKQLKFKFEYNTIPNYWYVVGKKRKHRFLFRKDVLVKEGFDATKTEHEIMSQRKIPRIYDCGNIKYIDVGA